MIRWHTAQAAPSLDLSHPLGTEMLEPQKQLEGDSWCPQSRASREEARLENCMTSSHSPAGLPASGFLLPIYSVQSRRLAPEGTQPPPTQGPSGLALARPPELGFHGSPSLGPTAETAKVSNSQPYSPTTSP